MQSFYYEFESRNVGLAAISTDLLVDAERMEVLAGAEFPILADTNEVVSRDYGVFNLLGDGVDIGDRVPTQLILEGLDVVLSVGGSSA